MDGPYLQCACLLTVADGNVNVGVYGMVGVGVIVGVSVSVGIDVSVGVKVGIEVGVSVLTSIVGVMSDGVSVDGAQAGTNKMINKMHTRSSCRLKDTAKRYRRRSPSGKIREERHRELIVIVFI